MFAFARSRPRKNLGVLYVSVVRQESVKGGRGQGCEGDKKRGMENLLGQMVV